jgi:hypothetical protein
MPRPAPRIAIRIPARRPRRHRDGSWSARSFGLFLVRQQAQAGLLRDGGVTADDVGRYVRRLRREAEEEIARLSRLHGDLLLSVSSA